MKIFLVLALLLTAQILMAQCEAGTAIRNSEGNNSTFDLTTRGNFIKNYMNPVNKKKLANISSLSFMFGGEDETDNLKVSSFSQTLNNKTDYYPGILNNFGQEISGDCNEWDKVFNIKKKDVFELREKYKNGTLKCDEIPDDIKHWPASNNPFLKNYENASFWATFRDENTDGAYNPCDGDYPTIYNYQEIRFEEYPEEINLIILNSKSGLHQITGGQTHQIVSLIYNYHFDSDNELRDADFYKIVSYNLEDSDLKNTYLGMSIDPEMGCPNDDKVGILLDKNLIYIYNKHLEDGADSCSNSLEYYPQMTGICNFRVPWAPKVFSFENGQKILKDPKPKSGKIDTLVNASLTSLWIHEECNNANNINCNKMEISDLPYYNLMNGYDKFGSQRITKVPYAVNPDSLDAMWNDPKWDNKNIDFGYVYGPMLLQPGAISRLEFFIFNTRINRAHDNLEILANKSNIILSEYNCKFMDYCNYLASTLGPKLHFIPQNNFLLVKLEDDFKNSDESYFAFEPNFDSEKNFDTTYDFEGHVVYQLASENVSKDDIINLYPDKVRIVHLCDVDNSISEYYYF